MDATMNSAAINDRQAVWESIAHIFLQCMQKSFVRPNPTSQKMKLVQEKVIGDLQVGQGRVRTVA
jgi:hypothetical protein